MKAKDYSEAEDWPGYFGAVRGLGPRETLVAAVDAFAREGLSDGFAVDVAAGEGRDTLELLKRGWSVLAADNHPEAFAQLLSQVPPESMPRLSTLQADFGATPVPRCDLANASFALPFCPPGHFEAFWSRILAGIRPGGRFAGQFFGKADSWASLPHRTHHTRDEVLALLEGFDIEMLRVEERDDPPDVRNPKHWQLFHVVARKA